MSVFSAPDFDGHEQVVFCHDKDTNLKAIIAIHNTNRGPALGGCRFWSYTDDLSALKDVLRLSRGMTYKAALANLPLGGGKAVIIGDAKKDKTPELMQAFGRFVDRLNGKYITAEDVNTTTEDMAAIRTQTKHVVGLDSTKGGSGDPSEITAYGIYKGIKASAKYRFNTDSLSGIHIAIQGLGHVGMNLAHLLHKEGARLTVTDLNQESVQRAIEEFGATAVAKDDIFLTQAEIFAPCALGAILNDQTIPNLKCQIVAGAANNQLAEARHGQLLRHKGILYAPDYVINAGGLINVTYEGPNYNRDTTLKMVDGIYTTLLDIFQIADAENISTQMASDRLAEQRFKNVKTQDGQPVYSIVNG